MKKDLTYWIYKTKIILESVTFLTEEERKLYSYNLAYHIANQMAHSGSSKAEVHEHLTNNISDTYHADALQQWFISGGNAPVVNFMRHNIKRAFGMQNVNEPNIEGNPVHNHLSHPMLPTIFNTILNQSRNIHKTTLLDNITIYRGISNQKSEKYLPHAIESWSTDIDTARHFAKLGMGHGHINNPEVYKATINRNDILLSHLTRHIHKFMPMEHELVGKEEIIPLGHRLKNLHRIE